MVMLDSQITDYKLRRGLHICKEIFQGTINSRMTIWRLWKMWKGYATEPTVAAENEKCWYLPHHWVYDQSKPGKIPVVFDFSAEFQEALINKSLLPGPDLANQIVGVLLRFREEPVAVTGDIEAMYH